MALVRRAYSVAALTAIALTASGLVATNASATGTTSTPAVTGRFVNAAGNPIPGLRVQVAPIDVVPLDGKKATPAVIGTATTDSDGRWSLTLASNLSPSVRAAARRNGGDLNLDATATGVGAGQTFIGSEVVAVHITKGAGPAARRASAAKGVMLVDKKAAATTSAQINARSTAADADVVNGVDYRAVIPTQPTDNWCDPWSWRTISRTVSWTTVGAAHDYWNSHGAFNYGTSASSSVGAEVSASGTYWSFGGWDAQSNSTGVAVTTPSLPAKTARQFQIPIKYVKQYGTQTCEFSHSHEYRIVGRGWVRSPQNHTVWRWGKSVIRNDGQAAYRASRGAYRINSHRGEKWTVTRGRSLTYGATAKAFGIGISAYTTYGTHHDQLYMTGYKRARWHHIWGVRGSLLGGHPGQLRAY